jgi:hypothetical protein
MDFGLKSSKSDRLLDRSREAAGLRHESLNYPVRLIA